MASRLVFEAMTNAMGLMECGVYYKLCGRMHGLLEEVRQGMEEAKVAVNMAAEAIKCNDGASEILQMLNTTVELAKKDPEAHSLLVSVLSLRFQQISEVPDHDQRLTATSTDQMTHSFPPLL